MPPQPCNVLLMSSRLYWYQGVSLLHYQALLGATLVNGEDQRATWRIFRCSPAWTWLKDLYFWLLWKNALKSSQGWRFNTERLIHIRFFWRFLLWNPKSLSPKKLSWRIGFWKKNTCRFPKPWPWKHPCFEACTICRICIHFDEYPEAKAEIHHQRGGGHVSSLLFVFFFASKV